MQFTAQRFDPLMDRILFVNPIIVTEDGAETSAQNALTFSFMFSGVRCIFQYAILPFILPVIGIAADATVPILLVINILAMVSIIFSLRRFWTIRYTHRWQYLFAAIVALILLTAFLWLDISALNAIA
jgi:hypothetical protein